MTERTKRLLDLLERHASRYKGHQPCLFLNEHQDLYTVHHDKVFPGDIREAVAELREMDHHYNHILKHDLQP